MGKSKIHITDEGVIFIDGLLADYEALNDAIEMDLIEMFIASKDGYNSLCEEYKGYLKNKATIAEIRKKLGFIKSIYKNTQIC